MELLRLGQLYNATDLPKEQKAELAQRMNLPYCIPENTCINLKKKSFAGYNCLHVAALKLDFDLLCELLKRGADLLKQGSKDRRAPVHIAVNIITNSKRKKLWEIYGQLQEYHVVKLLLLAQVQSNRPFNPKCKDGISHLHIACMFNCVEAVKFFLKNGEAINQVTNVDAHWPSYTPLHFAMRYSSVETVQILLNNGTDLLAKDAKGTTPLHILITRLLNVADYVNMGQYTLCIPYQEELKRLETIASNIMKWQSGDSVKFLNDTGLTNFHVACALRDPSIAANFLFGNFDLNMPVKNDCEFWPGWTPLHFAACSSAETVQLLMKKGADITIRNKKGETPLDLCLKRYPPRIIHSILSTKEEFESILLSDTFTPLVDLILSMDNITSFLYYLENLPQPNATVSFSSPILPGYSLLHLAVCMNDSSKSWDDFLVETDSLDNVGSLPQAEDELLAYSDRIRACLTARCSVDLKNRDGSTPVHLALETRIPKPDSLILKELLNYSQEDSKDADGLSHLHIACAIGNQIAVQNLLNVGANIDAPTNESFHGTQKLVHLLPDTQKLRSTCVHANSTPLHIAVAFGHADVVDVLLDNGADAFALDSEGFTPIHLSVVNDSNEIAKTILSHPQELIEMVTKEGLSHLHVAAFAGDVDAIRKLFCNGASVNDSVNPAVPAFLARFAGKTALQIATQIARGNVAPAVEALIEFGADIYINDTLQCLMGESDFEVVRHLVERLQLRENVKEPLGSSGLTLLHVACSRYDVDWASELLNKGADVNARIRNDEDYEGRWKGYTPLHALVCRKNVNTDSVVQSTVDELGKLLLSRGADVTIDSVDGTPLHLAYREYMKQQRAKDLLPTESPQRRSQGLPAGLLLELAKRRLQGLAQGQPHGLPRDPPQRRLLQAVELARPNDGLYNIHENVTYDSLASSMLCSQKSYEINPISPDGFTHFHFFCTVDNVDAVRQYLNKGVDVDHSTNAFTDGFAGYAALHFAVKYEAFNVVDLLVERGADVNVENADGNTPLHLVIQQNLIDSRRTTVDALKRHGANFNARNLLGETPADVLMTNKNFIFEQLQYLLSNGSSINVKKSSTLPGPAALIMQNTSVDKQMEIFKLFFSVCDMQAAVKSGYNPIQDIVRAKNNVSFDAKIDELRADDYLQIMREFVNAGCEVDELDENGFTALHNAIVHDNAEAVYVLLQLGADVNACRVDSKIFRTGSKLKIEKYLAIHVHKMHALGLYVSDTSNSIYNQFRARFYIDEDTEMSVGMELERMEMIKFNEKLSARAFLSELWAIVLYARLPPMDREFIDTFFKNFDYLVEAFPLLCGIMLCQYNKALVRPQLKEIAKEVLTFECEIYLTELCWDRLSRYLSNDDLKFWIQHSREAKTLLVLHKTN